jgi:hypothetical protein
MFLRLPSTGKSLCHLIAANRCNVIYCRDGEQQSHANLSAADVGCSCVLPCAGCVAIVTFLHTRATKACPTLFVTVCSDTIPASAKGAEPATVSLLCGRHRQEY